METKKFKKLELFDQNPILSGLDENIEKISIMTDAKNPNYYQIQMESSNSCEREIKLTMQRCSRVDKNEFEQLLENMLLKRF